VFTKIIRELTVAARSGLSDPAQNPRLRAAMTAARAANMPKDTMERAIRRGTGEDGGASYEEVRYEGFGPGGVAVIVEALTDNRNRTAGEIRTVFSKNGGTLGETNSVSFMFTRLGSITYPSKAASAEAMFEAALEAGAGDVQSTAEGHEVTCPPDDLNAVRESLEGRFGAAQRSGLVWKPMSTVELGQEAAEEMFELLEMLEENDDVQNVSSNFSVSDEIMARLTA
jgi:YebC/PmpR family DNA-binding regulatory protein